MIAALDVSNPADYLRQLTDAYRLHLFDIVMQFRAIFADAAGDGAASGTDSGVAAKPVSPVLFSWAQHRVQFYVDRMQELLPTCAARNCRSTPAVHCWDVSWAVALCSSFSMFTVTYACRVASRLRNTERRH
jgi:hypothetical protein